PAPRSPRRPAARRAVRPHRRRASRRTNSVAIGAKRRLLSSHHAAGFMGTRLNTGADQSDRSQILDRIQLVILKELTRPESGSGLGCVKSLSRRGREQPECPLSGTKRTKSRVASKAVHPNDQRDFRLRRVRFPLSRLAFAATFLRYCSTISSPEAPAIRLV